ncbi:MAG TPA: glycosyltransferase [Candidatus Mediterraneibacter norfolkensis]|nr:glycosyltransferase [Candidatus Mediterraneibacter norfolkensis]
MNRQIKISVIMGVYNPEKEKLARAVRSVIGQTLEDWEMILYDDGSKPSCSQAVREAAGNDSRICYIKNEKNHGLAYALNQCISRAGGKYIARMDDDDECMPERFERQFEFLESHPEYQWVGSNAELFDENGIWGIQKVSEIPGKKDFLKFSPYIHPSVMFRRNVLVNNHGYISAKKTFRCEDYELFMRLHLRGYRGYNIQENLILYREDAKSYEKRKIVYRVNEMMIRYRGFRRMGILKISTVPYIFRPLAGSVVPSIFVKYLRRRERDDESERHAQNKTGTV